MPWMLVLHTLLTQGYHSVQDMSCTHRHDKPRLTTPSATRTGLLVVSICLMCVQMAASRLVLRWTVVVRRSAANAERYPCNFSTKTSNTRRRTSVAHAHGQLLRTTRPSWSRLLA